MGLALAAACSVLAATVAGAGASPRMAEPIATKSVKRPKKTAVRSKPSAPVVPSTSPLAGVGDSLTVTGGLALTMRQGGPGTARCAKTTDSHHHDLQTGFISFTTPDGRFFKLQLDLMAGRTTFPAATSTGFVSLYDSNDGSMQWAVGTNETKSVTGLITMSDDLLHGTVDTDMAPAAAKSNSALTPIHVKGSFSCPAV